ncbi:MAG: hypothetical protein V3W51_00380, partial [Candidatus Brocadiales bacterium]
MKATILCLGPVLLALAGGPAAYFLLLKIPWVRNTAWPNILILLVAASWAVMQYRQGYSTCSAVALALTLAVAAGFIYLRFGLASLPEAHLNVAVGSKAPDFRLPDSEGQEFTL